MTEKAMKMVTQAPSAEFMVACEECGLVVNIPALEDDQKGVCPRCHHTLIKRICLPYHRPAAYGISCLIMLILSISFPFLSFSVKGISQQITLLNTAEMLQHFENGVLAILLMLTVIVFPALYVILMLFLYYCAARIRVAGDKIYSSDTIKLLCRFFFKIEPWLMVDVFLIGVLVSLVKISSVAHIGLGQSFWTFCIFSVLVVKCVSLVDKTWLWNQFFPIQPIDGVSVGDSHLDHNHVSCHMCNQLNPIPTTKHARCLRCDSCLHLYNPHHSLQYAWAFLLASIVFYIPANLYPMMYTVNLGKSDGSTIIGGVILLWQMGSWPVAIVIFIASILIPLSKMFILAWLYYSAARTNGSAHDAIRRLRIYRVTEFIGRWSMIDIFVVAILVALVQLQNLMAISPGPAALCFASVVIFTMISAMSFDSRAFWRINNKSQGYSKPCITEPESVTLKNSNEASDYE